MLKYLNIAMLLWLTAMVAACGNEQEIVPPSTSLPVVNLCISVATNDPQPSSRPARAGESFEGAIDQYELIKTLRVILTDVNGKIEFNEFVNLDSPQAAASVVMKVTEFGAKKVYLVANEASCPGLNVMLLPGSQIPDNFFAHLLSVSGEGATLIDNTGAEKKYLPMAEQYDLTVSAPASVKTEEDVWQYANLFVTRAAVKFSFFVKASTNPVSGNSFTVTHVSFSKLGDSSFLFPTGTVYSPEKAVQTGNPADPGFTFLTDRTITQYSVPSTAVNSPVVFPAGTDDAPWTFTSTTQNTVEAYGGEDDKYAFGMSPALYFPETKLADGEAYQVSLTIVPDGDTENQFTLTGTLPDLNSLPRNLHVVIRMNITEKKLACEVVLVPYIEVILKPGFGFDEVRPKPKKPVEGE